jgi:hypothetical protein
VAVWRLVNKYLPADPGDVPPPLGKGEYVKPRQKEKAVTEPDEEPVLDVVDVSEDSGDDVETASGWTPEGDTDPEKFTPEPVKGDE